MHATSSRRLTTTAAATPAALVALVALVALAPLALGAQAGSSAAIVLELPASTRAMALGGAYGAVGSDDAVLFYNPAGLATVERMSAGLSVQRHLASSTLAAASGAAHVGPGTLGLGLQVLDYGSEPEIVPDPAYGGERGIATGNDVSAQDLVATVGYGLARGRLRAGLGAKLVRQRIAGASGSAPAFDIGGAMDLPYGATLSAALQNVGGDLAIAGTSAPLPKHLRLGAAMPIRGLMPVDLFVTGQLVQPREGRALPAGGIEAQWRSTNGLQLAARAGAASRPEDSAASMLTFGAGLASRHLGLDYAYQGYDLVGGGVHRLGVRWQR